MMCQCLDDRVQMGLPLLRQTNPPTKLNTGHHTVNLQGVVRAIKSTRGISDSRKLKPPEMVGNAMVILGRDDSLGNRVLWVNVMQRLKSELKLSRQPRTVLVTDDDPTALVCKLIHTTESSPVRPDAIGHRK